MAEEGLLDNESLDTPDDAPSAEEQSAAPHLEVEVPERPEWLPENFFDPKKGANYEGLAKSYNELRTKFSQGKHKAPEGGKYDLSAFGEAVKQDDPALQMYTKWAADHGLSQDAFESLAKQVLELAGGNKQQTVRTIQQEREALGPKGDAIMRGMSDWARKLVKSGVWSAEDFEEFKVWGGTAGGIRAMMKLRESYEGRIPDVDIPPQGDAVTTDDLVKMINDPRYETDVRYREKVERLAGVR